MEFKPSRVSDFSIIKHCDILKSFCIAAKEFDLLSLFAIVEDHYGNIKTW